MIKFGKNFAIVIILASMIVSLAACSSSNSSNNNSSGKEQEKIKLVVGGKDFTEQLILSKITTIYLKEKGYVVEEAGNMGSAVVRNALENKQIDLYWEYTGTALVVYQKQEVETDPQVTYDKVKEADKANGLVWLNKANFNNTYAILMRQEQANELGIKTISDLSAYYNENPDALKFASNAEFYARDDGMKGVEAKYGFEIPSKNVTKMDSGLLYNALHDGQVDVSVGFATDGRIKGFDLIALEDDKFFFPAYNGAPVIREEVLNKDPKIADFLNQIADKLNSETMMKLNYTVDVEHKDVAEVAREWLVSESLLK
jgi:osmoprotectant transport system substrate-binding protein